MQNSPLSFVQKTMSLPTLAKKLGLTKAAVYAWRKNGIPVERVIQIEEITGVSRHNLRPDLFGNSGGHIAARHNSIS